MRLKPFASVALLLALCLCALRSQAANEFQGNDTPGKTVYYVEINQAGQFVIAATPGTSEAETDAHWGTYAVTSAEQGTTSEYFGSAQAGLPAGVYTVTEYEQAGGSPAVGDTVLATIQFAWTGTAEVTPTTLLSGTTNNGTAITAVQTTANAVQTAVATVQTGTTNNGTAIAGVQTTVNTLQTAETANGTAIGGVQTTATAINTKLGTPAGSSMSADIAADQKAGSPVTLPTTAPTGYGGSGSAPTASQVAAAVWNYIVDPLGTTPLTAVDAFEDIWDVTAGPSGPVTRTATTQTTPYLRNDGTTTNFTSVLTTDSTGKLPLSRTRANGTRP